MASLFLFKDLKDFNLNSCFRTLTSLFDTEVNYCCSMYRPLFIVYFFYIFLYFFILNLDMHLHR